MSSAMSDTAWHVRAVRMHLSGASCPEFPRSEIQGSKCRVQGVRFRILGLGFEVWGSGFRVQGLGFRV